MKRICFIAAGYALFCIVSAFHMPEKDCALARAPKVNNRLVFYHNTPESDYEVAFTFSNNIPNFVCNNSEGNINESLANANTESANQGRLYDALIIGEGTDRDVAITWKDKTKDNSTARVNKTEGKYVFVGCEPICDYEVVFKKDVSRPGQRLAFGTCPTDDQIISDLMKGADKKKIEYDAIMITNSKNDLVIKFSNK
jgi:hypothetical protein